MLYIHSPAMTMRYLLRLSPLASRLEYPLLVFAALLSPLPRIPRRFWWALSSACEISKFVDFYLRSFEALSFRGSCLSICLPTLGLRSDRRDVFDEDESHPSMGKLNTLVLCRRYLLSFSSILTRKCAANTRQTSCQRLVVEIQCACNAMIVDISFPPSLPFFLSLSHMKPPLSLNTSPAGGWVAGFSGRQPRSIRPTSTCATA